MKTQWVIVFSLMLTVFCVSISTGEEADITKTRVPADQLAAAQALKNPFPATPENIAKGKEIFTSKGTCFTCHGEGGKGDGVAAIGMVPSPRNFTNPLFPKLRTPGEMMWVIKNGSPETGMVSYSPGVITEEEAWLVILFERSLGGERMDGHQVGLSE
jgi:mono/diheme cytochrome c family protein